MTEENKQFQDSEAQKNAILDALEKQAKSLQEQIRLARGTVNKVPTDLRGRVEQALRERPRSQEELAQDLGEAVGKISDVLKEVRPRLRNVGSEDRPAWWLPLGEQASTPEINEAVLGLMAYRPMSSEELADYTGVSKDRVAGALGAAVKNRPVVDVAPAGAKQRRWFLLPPTAKPAK